MVSAIGEFEELGKFSEVRCGDSQVLRRLDAEAPCSCLKAVRDREADLPFQVIVCFPDMLLAG